MHRTSITVVSCFILYFLSAVTAMAEAPRIRMQTTKGDIVIELNEKEAPQTVSNFLTYVRAGHYNDTIFHRVIKGFMIQGGGFNSAMAQKPTRPPIQNEADNGLKNRAGTIAMARTPDPHSATAQFFINAADNGFLDFTAKSAKGWGYCVFGRVIEGMNVVRAIENSSTGIRGGHQDVPVESVIITGIAILNDEKTADPSAKKPAIN